MVEGSDVPVGDRRAFTPSAPAGRADDAAAVAAAGAVDPEQVLEFARALIGAPSENPGGTEDLAAEVVGDILAGLNASPRVIRSPADRPSVVAAIGSGAQPRLAWNGHLDVVPAGAAEDWDQGGPWEGAVRGDRLIGRGAADMKGPIAAALAAAAAIRRAGIELAGTFELHLAADEELAGIHGTKVLWEEGLLDQDAAIVGEPSELDLGLAERGGAWMTLTAHGRAAHGSQPHRGVNAITSMARALLRLPEALPDLEHPLVGRPTVNAALITGGSAPNVVPDRCVVDVDRRIIPGETDRETVRAPFVALVERIRQEHPEVEIDVALREWTDAAEAPEGDPLVSLAGAAVRIETGREPRHVGFTGITDARFYLNDARIPTIILGPGSLSVAHTANESVPVDELVAAARAYARIAVAFCGTV